MGVGVEGVSFGFWLVVGLGWLAGTFGGGWVLAWWSKRLHPTLAFYKLWALWAAVLNGLVALLMIFGLLSL